MSTQTQPTPTKLISPFKGQIKQDTNKIQAAAPSEIHQYIYGGVLIGVDGAQAITLQIFIKKLYDELQRRGLTKHWEPDNESRVAELLHNLNFKSRDEWRTDFEYSGGVADLTQRLSAPHPPGNPLPPDVGRSSAPIRASAKNPRPKSSGKKGESSSGVGRHRDEGGEKATEDQAKG